MIYFFPNCVDAIRTLPAMQHDKDNIEDVDTNGEDHCFAAGTMVDTVCGAVPIERLSSNGFVHSVNDIEFYRNARLVKKNAEVVRLTFEDGKIIVCTPDHGFLVDFDELRYAGFLKGESVLCSQSLSAQPSKSSTVSVTISAASIFSTKVVGSILQCGNITRDLFQMVITSITRKRGQITESMILSALPSKNISADVTEINRLKTAEKVFQKHKSLLPSGMGRTKENLGTRDITKKTSAPRWSAGSIKYACTVAVSSWLSKFIRREPNSAGQTVRRVRCVNVERLSERQDVYCITVPSNGLFSIEGGLLVSNCPDEIRYACMSRPYSRPDGDPEKGRIMTVGPDNELKIADVMGDYEKPSENKFMPYKRI